MPSTPPPPSAVARGWRKAALAVWGWFDAETGARRHGDAPARSFDLLGTLPMIAVHVACLGVLVTGASALAIGTCVALFLVRMFFVTAFHHRYFSHRSYRANRFWQAVFAVLAGTCVQRGALWWAAHHRHHHRHSDTPLDVHSPRQHGFLYSHMLWIASPSSMRTRIENVPDLARYPELRFLDRFHLLVPILLAVGLYLVGSVLGRSAPEWGVSGAQLLFWGFFVSTVCLFHATVTINSLAHVWGSRRYETRDDSRNNLWLALLTFGEGWHNNHHHYPAAARQGHAWWEVDLTYYLLWILARLGVVRDLKPVPARVRAVRLVERGGD